jgi:hypothetical protein
VPLVVNDDAVILDSGIRLKFLRDAEYDPAPPLVAISGDDQVLLKCTADGKLKVDASVSIEHIDIGDVSIMADNDSGVGMLLRGIDNPIDGKWSLYTHDPRFQFTGGCLNVNLIDIPDTGGLNKYGTGSTLDGVWKTIVTQSVGAGQTLDLSGMVVWGDADADWVVEIGGIVKGGCRTSPSKLTETIPYIQPLQAIGVTTVAIRVRHYYPSKTIDFSASMQGRLY